MVDIDNDNHSIIMEKKSLWVGLVRECFTGDLGFESDLEGYLHSREVIKRHLRQRVLVHQRSRRQKKQSASFFRNTDKTACSWRLLRLGWTRASELQTAATCLTSTISWDISPRATPISACLGNEALTALCPRLSFQECLMAIMCPSGIKGRHVNYPL